MIRVDTEVVFSQKLHMSGNEAQTIHGAPGLFFWVWFVCLGLGFSGRSKYPTVQPMFTFWSQAPFLTSAEKVVSPSDSSPPSDQDQHTEPFQQTLPVLGEQQQFSKQGPQPGHCSLT